MTEDQLKKNNTRHDRAEMLKVMRKKLIMRGTLIISTVLLAGVLLFTLTAAWYTNIIGTDGISFSAKQWNFNGSVTIGDSAPLEASPGDSGIVPMTIRNQGSELATASVIATKAGFSGDAADGRSMKQRIYFYVDAPLYRNGERLDRAYVSAYSSYTYTLFPQSELVLNDEQQDSYPLRWEWVYDVLGYYVMGRPDEDGNVVVEEYMRPIEYEYDMFATTFDAQGNLVTVDGTKTAAQLLAEVSSADGYQGTIEPSQKTAGGYYPVSVNSENYGVWAYLCTYDEIKAHSEYDTKVGTGEIKPQCPVVVTVTGSNSNGGAVEVDSLEMLTTILATSTHASVKLTENIALHEQVTLPAGSRVEIDLNGKTLTSSADKVFSVTEGSKLTINGGDDLLNPGEIVGKGGAESYGILATGAQVELNNVRVLNVQEGIKVVDHQNDTKTDSYIRIVDSTIIGSDDALWVYGNGNEGETATTVIVERCRLYGNNYIAINCNGAYSNIHINVTDSYIEGYYAGVYLPQDDSAMTLKNCTIVGRADAGIVIKGGTVDIIDCTITAEGRFVEWGTSVSGFADSGAGVYIEANYNWSVKVNISGNTVVSSENSDAIRLTKSAAYDSNGYEAKIVITGGAYTSAKTATYKDGETDVTVTIDGSVAAYLPNEFTEVKSETETTVTYTVTTKEPSGEVS